MKAGKEERAQQRDRAEEQKRGANAVRKYIAVNSLLPASYGE